jgi:hypothetical protein
MLGRGRVLIRRSDWVEKLHIRAETSADFFEQLAALFAAAGSEFRAT